MRNISCSEPHVLQHKTSPISHYSWKEQLFKTSFQIKGYWEAVIKKTAHTDDQTIEQKFHHFSNFIFFQLEQMELEIRGSDTIENKDRHLNQWKSLKTELQRLVRQFEKSKRTQLRNSERAILLDEDLDENDEVFLEHGGGSGGQGRTHKQKWVLVNSFTLHPAALESFFETIIWIRFLALHLAVIYIYIYLFFWIRIFCTFFFLCIEGFRFIRMQFFLFGSDFFSPAFKWKPFLYLKNILCFFFWNLYFWGEYSFCFATRFSFFFLSNI